MIVAADWVLPVAGRPIRDGAVQVCEGRIGRVGTIVDLIATAPGEHVERFDGCAIVPGLVNAHTHLSLSVLGGLMPRMAMQPFLRHVFAALRVLTDEDYAASAALGAAELLRGGVTCVGDITYGPEPLLACSEAGVGGVFFWEVLGIEAADLPAELARSRFPARDAPAAGDRTRRGLSPHTPYTSGPDLLRAARALARERQVAFAIHASESESERELMLRGTGPLADAADRLAHGFVSPGTGSVEYLERLGVLEDAVAVHCVALESSDPARLARLARGVVLCPRSNSYLGNGEPPVRALRAAGVPLAVGTDSPASNDDLDLFSEARALRALDPSLTPGLLLEIMTTGGARVLGLQDEFGSLEEGKAADMTVVRVRGGDPVEAVITGGGPSTVHAVMSAGVWRIREGAPVSPESTMRARARRARDKASAAIAAAEIEDPGSV